MPPQVLQAVFELANHSGMASGSLTATAAQARQRVKVDVIEVEYAASASEKAHALFPLIDGLLRDWIISDDLRTGYIMAGSRRTGCC